MKTYKKLFSIILVMAISFLSLSSANTVQAVSPGRWAGTLYTEFSKIGDGDSILLEQNSNFILADVGRWGDSTTVKSTLTKRGVNYLQAIIISHYDADHAGGILEVASHINNNIGNVYARFYSKTDLTVLYQYSQDDVFFNYIKVVNLIVRISNLRNGTSIAELPYTANVDTVYAKALSVFGSGTGIWKSPNRGSANIAFGNATIEWKNRAESYLPSVTGDSNFSGHVNNDSLVFRIVTVSGIKLLFLGDLGTTGVANLVSSRSTYPIDCDVLKISHHGHRYSTSQNLLTYTTPVYSIVTCASNEGASTLTTDTSARLSTLTSVYTGLGKVYYVGSQSSASSTLAVTNASVYDLGTLFYYGTN